MDKIPFSIYDFFGYLASGFILLIAVNYTYGNGSFLTQEISIVLALFLVVVSYILGHIVANFSSFLFEEKFVKGVLKEPSINLFCKKPKSNWRRIFPGFYRPLPEATCSRILSKTKAKAGFQEPGQAVFYHCFQTVKSNEKTLGRLNIFLNLYGFSRNVSMSLLLCSLVLLSGWLAVRYSGSQPNPALLWGAIISTFASVGMFYRYLKFFRQYSVEVFTSYAEVE